MLKISNRNTRCLFISKIILKTSGRRHLTTSYLSQVTVQNHVFDSFSQNIYQFTIKRLLSVLLSSSTARNFNNSRPIYVILRNEKSLLKYLIHENSECQHFLFLKKQSQNFFTFQFLLFIQRAAISGSQSQTSLFCVIYLYICNISISMYYILQWIFEI